MTKTEVRKLDVSNYEIIKALNLIAIELIHGGEIISNKRTEKEITVIIVKYNNILYRLHMYGGDTCHSITWDKMEE